MKDHVEERRYLDPYGTVDEFIAQIKSKSVDLIEPFIEEEYDYDRSSVLVKGWRPMTPRELATAERRRKASRKANAAKKEKEKLNELAELQRLMNKYKEELTNG